MGKSEYPRVEDLLSKIEEREQIHGLVEPRQRSSVKYKKEPKDKIERPALKVGKRVVYTVGLNRWSKHPLKGYALGVILDWSTNDSWWQRTQLIIQTIRVSNPSLEHLIGHLHAIDIGEWGDTPTARMPFLVPEEGDPKDYKL